MTISIHHSDCVAWLQAYDGPLFDSCVTDPPYHLTSIVKRFGGKNAAPAMVGATGAYARASKGFMGKEWDGGDVAFRPETWHAVYEKLKPGAHLVAFSGTRTYHRMACAIEDAGFEIRDQLQWIYGSGFPKSHDVSKGIDRVNGDRREQVRVDNPRIANAPTALTGESRPWLEKALAKGFHEKDGPSAASAASAAWHGWGTALKPACEPICLARKPLSEKSIAANVLKHGTGAINIDLTRIGTDGGCAGAGAGARVFGDGLNGTFAQPVPGLGRWPANVLHDGSDEVLAGLPATDSVRSEVTSKPGAVYGNGAGLPSHSGVYGFDDSGSAARYFYSAKAGPLDRIGSKHPTIKPVDLMRWLVRLVTPPGGHILEPFAGSGSTGIAALAEGFDCTMIDLEADHVADIERKLAYLRGEGRMRVEEHLNGREHAKPPQVDLFNRESAA